MQKLNLEKIVIGGDLRSLLYSYIEGIPILLHNAIIPFENEVTPNGINKKLLWQKLSFTLSCCGFNPYSDKVSSYRVDEETGNIIVIGKTPFKSEIQSGEIIILPENTGDKKFIVYDHFSVRGHEKPVEYSTFTDELITDVFLYKERKTQYGIARTVLTEQQLKSEEYSETYIRFRIIDILKSWGVKGRPIMNKPTNFKLDMKDRRFVVDNSLIEDTIIDEMQDSKNEYIRKVVQLFGDPYGK